MHISEWLSKNNKKQADLARIIKRGEEVTKRDRVRAHRIFHGSMPNEEEMPKIFNDTRGQVTANDFYGIREGHPQ